MATRITDTLITSDITSHRAEYDPHRSADGNGGWAVSWLPLHKLTRDQALTAITLAEFVAQGVGPSHKLWPHLQNFAAELGLDAQRAMDLTFVHAILAEVELTKTYVDSHGTHWHVHCSCGGVIGANCPVCNPTTVEYQVQIQSRIADHWDWLQDSATGMDTIVDLSVARTRADRLRAGGIVARVVKVEKTATVVYATSA